MQVVLPLLLVLFLLVVLQPVDLHCLGGLGFPHISGDVWQSHGNHLLRQSMCFL